MRMTIGKKLITSFLVMAMLVLLSGIVGFVVLNNSSQSADTVAKEKAPVQYAVMNATLAIEKVQRFVMDYTSKVEGLETIASHMSAALNEFDMWIAMIQLGTASPDFKESSHGEVYTSKNLNIAVMKGSDKMLTSLETILQEQATFKQTVAALIDSHNKDVSYLIPVGETYYSLPDFLNLAQISHLDWLMALRDAVNIETTFTGNMDPTKGLVGEWLSSGYKVEKTEFNDVYKKLQKQHKKLLALAVKINEKETYKDKLRTLNRGIGVTAKIEKYFGKMHPLSASIYQEQDAEEKKRHAAMAASALSISSQLDALIGDAALEMHTALLTADKVKTRGTIFLAAITLAAVVIAIIMGTLMSRYLAGRIHDLAEATKKIAQGDLQKTMAVTSADELGDLAQDTNSMITSLREIIGQVLAFSGNLTQSSHGLAEISNDLDGNAKDLNTQSTKATDATARMSSSMLDIATTANDSMQRVQNVAQATDEMSATINEIAENTEQARAVSTKAVVTVEKTTVKMNELSEAAKEIGKVADVIVSIADQTNLLSLNATIEAARAGDAGKGFAVVANEVKELAGQTNLATGNIREKIAAIQQSSDMTIAEINEIATVINNINSIVVVIAGAVEEQAVTTQQIAKDISTVSTGIQDMSGNVDSASEVAESVSHDINAVSATSSNVQTGSTQVNSNATELAKLAEDLQGLVGKFKL